MDTADTPKKDSKTIIDEAIAAFHEMNKVIADFDEVKNKLSKLKESDPKIIKFDAHFAHIPYEVAELHKEVNHIRDALANLPKFLADLTKPLKILETNIKDICDGFNILDYYSEKFPEVPKLRRELELEANIGVLRSNITKLKIRIPLEHQLADRDYQNTIPTSFFDEVPRPSEGTGEKLRERKVYKEMKRMFEEELVDKSITDPLKRGVNAKRKQLCLLCFAVFPEDAEIRRRLLHLWWIGEDLLPKEGSADFADKALDEFVRVGFIEPVKAETRPDGKAKSFKMCALTRAVLIELAKEAKFLDLDSKGKPSRKAFESRRACLVKKTIEEEEEEKKNLKSKEAKEGLKKLRTLFNVSEQVPDLRIPKQSFIKMKDIGVVCFGRWENSGERHIEADSVNFLKALLDKKKLRFLSLQGMSRVTYIPTLGAKLRNLKILDLRACYSLEELPKNMDVLQSLTYLDMSECCFLDLMPKKMAMLYNLQVLKGFVVSDNKNSCPIGDLTRLKELQKLGLVIYSKGWEDVLFKFKKLEKLKMAWADGSTKQKKQHEESKVPSHRHDLGKLDLEFYQEKELPKWMGPDRLHKLKKLYIRGGNLKNLRSVLQGGEKWKVEILRLKYLDDLKMDWEEIQDLFPNLWYLEKVKCPKITLCPCDGNGVWIDREKRERMMNLEKNGEDKD